MGEISANVHVLRDIPVRLHADDVMKRLSMRSSNQRVTDIVHELLETVNTVAKPLAMYCESAVTAAAGDTVVVGGVNLECNCLRVLGKVKKVFPYVTTVGTALDSATKFAANEAMKTYCSAIIKTIVVGSATAHLQDYLMRQHGLPQVSSLSPGHPQTWPLSQRKELFSLLGDVEGTISVRLTDKFLLMPVDSVCGVLYPTSVRVERCYVCSSETCRERRVPYDSAALQ